MFTAFGVELFSEHPSHLVDVEMLSNPVEDDIVEDESSTNDREEEVDFIVGESDSFHLSIGFDFELVVGVRRCNRS